MRSIAPYLLFDDQCKDAFKFYKKIFNASTKREAYFGKNVIGLNQQNLKGKLADIWLFVDQAINIRGCNRSVFLNQFGVHIPFNIMIIDTDSIEELVELYERLSYKGRSVITIGQTETHGYFCMVIDQFGAYWIIAYDASD